MTRLTDQLAREFEDPSSLFFTCPDEGALFSLFDCPGAVTDGFSSTTLSSASSRPTWPGAVTDGAFPELPLLEFPDWPGAVAAGVLPALPLPEFPLFPEFPLPAFPELPPDWPGAVAAGVFPEFPLPELPLPEFPLPELPLPAFPEFPPD